MKAAADRRLMFGTKGETEIDGVSGIDSETNMGSGLKLVSSEEDTTEGIARREVLEHQTDATEGSDTDTRTGRISI